MNIIDKLKELKGFYCEDYQRGRAEGIQYATEEIQKNGIELYTVEYKDAFGSIETAIFLKKEDADALHTKKAAECVARAERHPGKYHAFDGALICNRTDDVLRYSKVITRIVK